VTSFDQLSTASGLFALGEYAFVLRGGAAETVIDLGCNVGWFTLWLAANGLVPNPRGLLIDADPRMVAEAKWHMERNGLSGCIVAHGAVGLPPSQTSTTFHIHPSSSASSLKAYQPGRQLPVKGTIVDITVPAISVAVVWQENFGQATVDLMKVDVEGAELEFVVNESTFLQQGVRRLVIEWHKWCVSRQELDTQLASIGFELRETFDETELAGLALYENSKDLG
jgi:FkbM family methyltransferase